MCVKSGKIGSRGNAKAKLSGARVVSPKAVSDTSSSLTCLDPDASSVRSLSLFLSLSEV